MAATVIPVDTSGITPPTFTVEHPYRAMVFETLSGDFVDDLPVSYFNCTQVLNGPGACEIHFPMWDNRGSHAGGSNNYRVATDYEEYAHSIVITEGDTCVWAGMWARTRASSNDRIGVAGIGFWDYWRNRMIRTPNNFSTTTRTYTSEDVLFIARDLVLDAQAGGDMYDLGVTTGSELSGVLADLEVNVYDFKYYADVIDDLAKAEATRFDHRIVCALDSNGSLTKRFECGAPYLGTRREFVAELGRNIINYTWERDGTQRMSTIYGLGAGEGPGMVLTYATDTTSHGRVPYRETILSRKEITSSQVGRLQSIVNGEMRKVSQPIQVTSMTLKGEGIIGAFGPGDKIQVIINDGFIQIDEWLRVLSITIRVQDDASATIDVELGPEFPTGGSG